MFNKNSNILFMIVLILILSVSAFAKIEIDGSSKYRNQSYEKMLLSTVAETSKILSTSKYFIIPTNLKIELEELSDHNAYFDRNMEKNYFYIHLPYMLKLGKSFAGNEMKPAMMHEFSHYIFKITAIKRSLVIRNKFMESEKIRAELRKLYKTPELSGEEEEKIKKRIDWLEDEIAVNIEGQEEKFGRSMAAYNELFADLVPALYYENTDIFTSIGVGRSFSARIDLKTWAADEKNHEEHVYFSPVRNLIYSLYVKNKSKMSKAEFLARSLKIMHDEIELIFKGRKRDIQRDNIDLAKRFHREFSQLTNR